MTVEINKDTQLCISIASRPSNFGTTLHNAGYAALGINFAYKAFEVSDLEGAIAGVRALKIRGCSLSMPFKEKAMSFLDSLDETAQVIGAINTIVNTEGHLKGYNTDAIGAKKVLESIDASPDESVLLLGAGGVARAILYALRQLGFRRIQVANRNQERIQNLQDILPCDAIPWTERLRKPADLVINATSIGMNPDPNEMPVDDALISQSRAVMDVVVSPKETRLIQTARTAGKKVAPGFLMSLEQALAQFQLYTDQKAPREVMEKILQQMK